MSFSQRRNQQHSQKNSIQSMVLRHLSLFFLEIRFAREEFYAKAYFQWFSRNHSSEIAILYIVHQVNQIVLLCIPWASAFSFYDYDVRHREVNGASKRLF